MDQKQNDTARALPSYFDQHSQPRRRVLQSPLICDFSNDIFVKLFVGMFSGSRSLMVIVKIFYLYRIMRDFETQSFRVHGKVIIGH